jgi:hypothetical protein
MTDPDTPILAKTFPTFQKLPPTFKQLLLHTNKKVVYAREPIPSGKKITKLLTDNIRAHIYPDNSYHLRKRQSNGTKISFSTKTRISTT